MAQPWNSKRVGEVRQSVQRIGRGRILFWFFVINLPVALVMSALIGWHNSVVGTPTAAHLLMRGALTLLAFAISGILFLRKLRVLAQADQSGRS